MVVPDLGHSRHGFYTMKQYLEILSQVLENGEEKSDRTGTGTRSLFGLQARYDLREGFPLVTTKKVLFPAVVRELLWFLQGSTNINQGLAEYTPIWNAWADEHGELGPIYGYQWRKWPRYTADAATRSDSTPKGDQEHGERYVRNHIDQITTTIAAIKNNPSSRRLIVSAWNVSDIDSMALPPCHAFFQFYVINGYLDCQLYQRSADLALGVPFNIASYSLLLLMVAQECELTPRYFIHCLGDAHIYLNHIEGVKKQLARTPGPLPQVKLAQKPVLAVEFEDVVLNNYHPQPFIKFPLAV